MSSKTIIILKKNGDKVEIPCSESVSEVEEVANIIIGYFEKIESPLLIEEIKDITLN